MVEQQSLEAREDDGEAFPTTTKPKLSSPARTISTCEQGLQQRRGGRTAAPR
ncbi:hypothetical protein ACJRO7_014585, partial [Eucalyptus globulus]